jgi:hypothetical protein
MAARTSIPPLDPAAPGARALPYRFLAPVLLAPILVAQILLAFTAAPGWAGEVTGRVELPPPAVKAAFAAPGLLDGLGAGSGANSTAAASPILVYVAEASAPLPRAQTAGAHLRLGGSAPAGPPLVALALGSTLVIESADSREHRLIVRGGGRPLDLGVIARGGRVEFTARETGVLSVACTLHKESAGEIVVLAHAAFTFADAEGGYRLAGLPPGLATVVAYSPRCGEVSREVTVPDSGQVEVGFKF